MTVCRCAGLALQRAVPCRAKQCRAVPCKHRNGQSGTKNEQRMNRTSNLTCAYCSQSFVCGDSSVPFRSSDSFLFIGKLHRQTQSAAHSRTPTTERMRFGARTPECLGTRPRTPPERTGKSSQAVRRDSAATSPRGHACSRESALPLAPTMPRSAKSVPCTHNPIQRLPTQTRYGGPANRAAVLSYVCVSHAHTVRNDERRCASCALRL